MPFMPTIVNIYSNLINLLLFVQRGSFESFQISDEMFDTASNVMMEERVVGSMDMLDAEMLGSSHDYDEVEEGVFSSDSSSSSSAED